jgi:hypothetical protein
MTLEKWTFKISLYNCRVDIIKNKDPLYRYSFKNCDTLRHDIRSTREVKKPIFFSANKVR